MVTLEVRAGNFTAQNLYLKYGFSFVGTRKGYYSDNREDALLMKTPLITSADYQRRFRQLTNVLQQRLLLGCDRNIAQEKESDNA
ncbi:MAG: hypothetical protein A2Y73_04695 [Chloroflexi bacterium RBG_13_56_8]|nr:MAG: hypothetical protein A2Y73_04695 [Chloroflexi bacterium RBG_13_56_8]